MKTSKADKYFSLFIRLRDSDENGIATCITCGLRREAKYLDCGHYIKRQHMATRFKEMNCAAQCKGCNRFQQGRDVIFRQKLVDKYGEDEVLILESYKRKNRKIGSWELGIIAKEYKEKANEIAKQKGLELW